MESGRLTGIGTINLQRRRRVSGDARRRILKNNAQNESEESIN